MIPVHRDPIYERYLETRDDRFLLEAMTVASFFPDHQAAALIVRELERRQHPIAPRLREVFYHDLVKAGILADLTRE